MFKYFYESKMAEIEGLAKLSQRGGLPKPWAGKRLSFTENLRPSVKGKVCGIIAEYKRASPSRGDICLNISPEEVALAYLAGGALAISVLTEETRFKGELNFLNRVYKVCPTLPLLRKDFIFHPLQILATAATPAAAVLLIVKLNPVTSHLREMRKLAEQHGLEAVVEVFDEADLKIARNSGAKIIQVNSRNFGDLSINKKAALTLAKTAKRIDYPDELWILASGLENSQDLKEAQSAGFDAVLIGTSLMKNGRPEDDLKKLQASYLEGEHYGAS
ncbi:MAG: indole-3-glycerol-phosphate synthase [Candidatus Adiutrix sp.]